MNNFPMIGSDEVGVGDYFGPLVVAACLVEEKDVSKLKSLGIADSKKLTDQKIIDIALSLKDLVKVEVEIFNNKQYNSLTDKGVNAHMLKAILHDRVHKKLAVNNGWHIIDQFVNERKYYEYFQTLGIEPFKKLHFETKAESKYIAVAAASIMARYIFLKEMDKLSKQVGFKLPLGAGDQIQAAIKEIRNKYDENKLKEIAKYSFANTKK